MCSRYSVKLLNKLKFEVKNSYIHSVKKFIDNLLLKLATEIEIILCKLDVFRVTLTTNEL